MPVVRHGRLLVLVLLVACAPKEPVNEPSSGPTARQPASRAAQVVNATILVNRCASFGRANGKLAEKTMYQLVEDCSSVPGGSAQFSATLQPNGRIEIGGAPGQPDVVPICVLRHSLTHRVPLSQPCRLDVKIEERRVAVGDGG